MAKLKTCCGIDVSKNYFDACILAEGKERQKRFLNDRAGIGAAAKWIGADIPCIMEATGPYYISLAVYLHQQGMAVSVVNPLVIKRFSQMRLVRTKTDKADARLIAGYGLSESLTQWTPPTAWSVTLQHLDALSDQLQKHHTALINQLHAFDAGGMMDKKTRQFITKAIRVVEKQQKEASDRMLQILSTYHGQMMKNLQSIPGLGKKTAALLVMVTNGFTRFDSYKQLSAYLGLCPRIYESGSSTKGKARICKMGMSRARALLYLCAWSARKCNKACKDLYERLISKNKAKKLALIAVANKLIKQAFAIATQNKQYNIPTL